MEGIFHFPYMRSKNLEILNIAGNECECRNTNETQENIKVHDLPFGKQTN